MDAAPSKAPSSDAPEWRPPAGVGGYAMIGDLHTAAMIGPSGSIDWLCLPRFDSAACFAAMLGDQDNGHWSIQPRQPVVSSRREYQPDTLILQTEFNTAEGRAVLIDFMPPRDDTADLVRIVRGVEGSVDFSMLLRIRFGYGAVVPWVRHINDGIAAVAGPDAVYLRSDVQLSGQDHHTAAEFTVSAGEQVSFVLTRVDSHEEEPDPTDATEALEQTQAYWADWISTCSYRGRWEAAVKRSLITLKALTYLPTGGIVAAATTSLPEEPGGVRNWDYRYCWLRDATFALEALVSCGYTEEAAAWRHWLLRAVGGDPEKLQVLYTVDGSRRADESELDWLSGFRQSRPVRVGNAAAQQFQLDIFGEVLDTLSLARLAGITQHRERADPTAAVDSSWGLQRLLLEQVERTWREPDDGLWEIRGERRHFVHSKVMAWVAFDRVIRGAENNGLDGDLDGWRRTREEIHRQVCAQGLDPSGQHFVQSYGSQDLDAALLLIGRVGFLPWEDPRITATVRAVHERLLDPAGFVRRYLAEGDGSADGIQGSEKSFLACSFWMVDALAGIGEVDAAEALFERLLRVGNDVGLIAEECDVIGGQQWGNMPQAYSHVGLINAARRLDGAGINRGESEPIQRADRAAPSGPAG
ncbi:MAG: glycoside hydrolase 15-like protein [Frankiales bacterium]|nr:glycoside hydrolase 15-like protein [Frankiales bacterium]